MFKISPIQDAETQEKYANMCGTKAKHGFFAYAMTDAESGDIMGFSQFEILGDEGYISDLRQRSGAQDDFEAMFILGRATMNFIDLCGAHISRAALDAADVRLLSAIGFKEKRNGTFYCDMTGFFDGHCDGHPVKL